MPALKHINRVRKLLQLSPIRSIYEMDPREALGVKYFHLLDPWQGYACTPDPKRARILARGWGVGIWDVEKTIDPWGAEIYKVPLPTGLVRAIIRLEHARICARRQRPSGALYWINRARDAFQLPVLPRLPRSRRGWREQLCRLVGADGIMGGYLFFHDKAHAEVIAAAWETEVKQQNELYFVPLPDPLLKLLQ